jgi:hypothetical protein
LLLQLVSQLHFHLEDLEDSGVELDLPLLTAPHPWDIASALQLLHMQLHHPSNLLRLLQLLMLPQLHKSPLPLLHLHLMVLQQNQQLQPQVEDINFVETKEKKKW